MEPGLIAQAPFYFRGLAAGIGHRMGGRLMGVAGRSTTGARNRGSRGIAAR
jgi:hypothetical protein